VAEDTQVDLSEFFKLSRPRRKPCPVGYALEQLEGEEKAQLEAALAAGQGIITAGAVEAWLKARGFTAQAAAVGSHRREQCTCGDD
jgi:hypothetical protein